VKQGKQNLYSCWSRLGPIDHKFHKNYQIRPEGTSCIYRCAHDASEVPLIALDFMLFGEYVPSCPVDGYPLFN
jgi:hypothetical protein